MWGHSVEVGEGWSGGTGIYFEFHGPFSLLSLGFPAETLKQRLEDLEQESDSLALALPSQQPAVHSFLGHLATQARAALHQATQL